ncbi:Card1-like endonuclease domain-containing protein [Pelistega sp. MC2]|uniref:Card1-like endonuclease domain-containing protein n=1 Tax=Pelistega sp. MC2 TaxID=1720297 RepID=UPI0008DA042F|nr:DUF1887 family CARF protein [Pelistega sp. MC2]
MSLHICLLSDQLLANYLPIKQFKPSKVLMLSTSYIRKHQLDQRFKRMVEKLGVECIDYPHNVPTESYVDIQLFFMECQDYIRQLGETDITLNLTGGNKLMTLSAYHELHDECSAYIYTNTSQGNIEFLENNQQPAVKLESLLNIDESLSAYGVQTSGHNSGGEAWRERVKNRHALTMKLAKFASDERKRGFIGALNYRCSQALDNKLQPNGEYKVILVKPTQVFDYLSPENREFLKDCQKHQLLSFDESQKSITFNTPQDALYLGGMWLEELVYHLAGKHQLNDYRCGQKVRLQKTDNELDVVMVHNNRLLVVECKTIRFSNQDDSDNDILYKLDSVSDSLKGLYGEAWLVSARSIDRESILERAKSLNIKIISGKDVHDLSKMLLEWANGK